MLAEKRYRTAGIVLLFGFVYLIFEVIAAMAWVDPPYDWARNLISALGFSDCAIVGTQRICSPLYPLMNAGFMVQGIVFTVGGILVARLIFPHRGTRALVATFLVTSGVGTFFVGVFHQSLALTAAGLGWLHFLAAVLAIGAGNVGIVLLGLFATRYREWRGYGIAVVTIGVVGVVASLFLLTRNDLGLGIGLIERVAVYPLNTWTIGTGVGLLIVSGRARMRRAHEWDAATPRAG